MKYTLTSLLLALSLLTGSALNANASESAKTEAAPATFTPLPASEAVLGKRDGERENKPAYSSYITNRTYEVMWPFMVALERKRYIQYIPVDAFPEETRFSVYRMEQAGRPTGTPYDGYLRPMQLAEGGKRLITDYFVGGGTDLDFIVDGKQFSLGDNTAPPLEKSLLMVTENDQCGIGGERTYYALDTGKELFFHRWEDMGFLTKDASLLSIKDTKDWILLGVTLAQKGDTEIEATLHAFKNAYHAEKRITLPLSIPFIEACGGHCSPEISANRTTYPDKALLPVYDGSGGSVILKNYETGKNTALFSYKVDLNGEITSLNCIRKSTCGMADSMNDSGIRKGPAITQAPSQDD